MTNMKALPMLDHVMLKLARYFAYILFLFAALEVWSRYSHPEVSLPSHSVLEKVLGNPYLFLARTVLWLICLEYLDRKMVRLCLGVSSGVFFAYYAFAGLASCFFGFFAFMPHSIAELLVFSVLAGLVGYGAMIWCSVRPPKNFANI